MPDKCPNCEHYTLEVPYDMSIGGGFGGPERECSNCGYTDTS